MFCFVTPLNYPQYAQCPLFTESSNIVLMPITQNILENTFISMGSNINYKPEILLSSQQTNPQYRSQISMYYPNSNADNNLPTSVLEQKITVNKSFMSAGDEQSIVSGKQESRECNEEKKLDLKEKPYSKKRKSQTKNLIKNYGKAILTFIIRNKNLRNRVLDKLKIRESEFLEEVYMFRDYVHTISALRYLWQSHPFSQAFRIMSCEYLRKYNLQHIFNSRVFKHGVYLKYQNKLMKSLERPQQFEAIKEL